MNVIDELERGVQAMTLALEQVRSAVARLADGEPADTPVGAVETVRSVPALALVDSEEHEDVAAAGEEPDDARPGPQPARLDRSWATMRVDSGLGFGPPPAEPASTSSAEDERREDVRAVVEAMRAELAAIEPEAGGAEEEPVDDLEPVATAAEDASVAVKDEAEAARLEEERREQVRLSVEAARAEMLAAQAPVPQVDEDEARREEVRRAVENVRNAMSWGQLTAEGEGDWGQFEPEPGGFTIRSHDGEDAPETSLIEAASDDGEPEATSLGRAAEEGADRDTEGEPPSLPEDDEEARREAVRLAVEAARAELQTDAAPPRIVPLLSRGDSLPRGADFSGPPIIVIEDSEGRVELAQVFATLSKLDRSGQAALLNYSPHSVTIGLNVLSTVPEEADLALAAEAVFGRGCSVTTEGSRTLIAIGGKRTR